jgi:hypothetical protein
LHAGGDADAAASQDETRRTLNRRVLSRTGAAGDKEADFTMIAELRVGNPVEQT